LQHSAALCRILNALEARQVARERRNCRVSVSLTEHEKEVLERIAERSDLSLSRIVQEAVREFAKDQADEAVDVLRSSRQLASA
jgi:hypothetical protein